MLNLDDLREAMDILETALYDDEELDRDDIQVVYDVVSDMFESKEEYDEEPEDIENIYKIVASIFEDEDKKFTEKKMQKVHDVLEEIYYSLTDEN